MALTVEDGTGVAGAESYLSVADATARLTALGYTKFASLPSDTVREQALRLSSRSTDAAFLARCRGFAVRETQGLAFPRTEVFIDGTLIRSDRVPEVVLSRCAHSAELHSYALADPEIGQEELGIKRMRGAKAAEVEYFAGRNGMTAERKNLAVIVNQLTARLAAGAQPTWPPGG